MIIYQLLSVYLLIQSESLTDFEDSVLTHKYLDIDNLDILR